MSSSTESSSHLHQSAAAGGEHTRWIKVVPLFSEYYQTVLTPEIFEFFNHYSIIIFHFFASFLDLVHTYKLDIPSFIFSAEWRGNHQRREKSARVNRRKFAEFSHRLK